MRASSIAFGFVLGTTLLACGAPGRDPGGDDTGGGDGGNNGSGNQDGCSDAAKLVYVVDSNNKLSTWDGATKSFHDIGTLACPASPIDPIFQTPATPGRGFCTTRAK